MAKYIATYDLTNTTPHPYTAFRDAALKLGWAVWVLASNGYWYRLPNTTLIGEFATLDAAEKAFDAIKPAAEKALGRAITVEKMFIAEYVASRVNSNETQKTK